MIQRGEASWYGAKFNGNRTASGERFNMRELTAAHPTLPFGTLVQVTNIENGRQVVVRINDRGPFSRRRIIDVSFAAAKELGLVAPGTARVELALVRPVPLPEPVQPLLPTPAGAVAVAELSETPSPGGRTTTNPANPATAAGVTAGAGHARTASALSGGTPGAVSLTFVPLPSPAEADPSAAEADIAGDPGPPPEPVYSREATPNGIGTDPTTAATTATLATPNPASAAIFRPLAPRTARPIGSLHYTVQVGAFSEPERADALRQQLATRYPHAAVRSDGIWNRVQVGLFADRDEADALRRELAESGLDALVTTTP